MLNIFNSDPTLLMIGAGGLLVILVVIFQIMTRPPAQKAEQSSEPSGHHASDSIRIMSRKALDDRRSLVTIRFGNSEHLLLLGDESDLLIESRPVPLRERHSDGRSKGVNAIPMPFPPQPVAKLNTRTNTDYQNMAPIAVPEFLQARTNQPAYAQQTQAPTASSPHPVMPQVVMPPSTGAYVPHYGQEAAPYSGTPVMPPPPSVNPTDEVTRKLEDAMRQTHQVHRQTPHPTASAPAPVEPVPFAPASAAVAATPAPAMQPTGPQGGVYAANSPEAFEDEIRKLLGRGPHAS